MSERRLTARQATLDNCVRCITTLGNGCALEGRITDSSEGGARITGDTSGLHEGRQIEIDFLFVTGEKVRYRGTVKHVDAAERTYGVEFDSEPVQIVVKGRE